MSFELPVGYQPSKGKDLKARAQQEHKADQRVGIIHQAGRIPPSGNSKSGINEELQKPGPPNLETPKS